MKTEETLVVRYVPYQLCPKCMGQGRVKAGSMEQSTPRTQTLIVCDVCHGAKIIPMCEIKENT
jgi:DnaJ-class molecular chaperone